MARFTVIIDERKNRFMNWVNFLKQRWLPILILVGTILISNWWLVTQPMFYTHDYLHGARIAELTRGLLSGQLPVVWTQNFGFGYGMPMFEFYAPLPYLVGSLFQLGSLAVNAANLTWLVKLLFVLVNLATLGGGYLLAREWYERAPAALAASFLTLASYRAMDLFARGAMSELWAIMALPWLLLGLSRLIANHRHGYLWTLLGGAILVLSHNITTMLVAPILVVWVIVLSVRQQLTGRKLWLASRRLLIAAALVFGLTAFYLIPALTEQPLTQVKQWILSDYFDYQVHFLSWKQFFWDRFGYGGSGYGTNDGLSFFLGWAQLLSLGLSLVALGWLADRQWRQPTAHRRAWLILGGGLLLCLLLALGCCLYQSAPIWSLMSSWWQFAQFPWRFLGIAIVFLSLLAPLWLTVIPRRQNNLYLLSIMILTGILWLTSCRYFRGDVTWQSDADAASAGVTVAADYYQTDPVFIREWQSRILVDYLPINFANEWQAVPLTQKVVNLEEQPTILVDQVGRQQYQFSLDAPTVVELAIADYPGWRVQINGEPAAYYQSATGNISLLLPAGESQVTVRFGLTLVRLISLLFTVSTGIIIVILLVNSRRLLSTSKKDRRDH